MKATGTCPKCNSKKITKVKGRMTQTHFLSYGRWLTRNEKLDTFVCTRCGFSERYAKLSDRFLGWAKDNIIEAEVDDNGFV